MRKITNVNELETNKCYCIFGNKKEKMSVKEALIRAHNLKLDLVMVGTKDNIPCCKITNYGKLCYNQKKNNKKKNKKIKTKQIKFNININENDYNRKIEQIKNFLDKKHNVFIIMVLKGREIELSKDKAKKFFNQINKDIKNGKWNKPPKFQGRAITGLMLPKSF